MEVYLGFRESGLHGKAAVDADLRELDRLVNEKADFVFESTLSGFRYAQRIQDWRAKGYSIGPWRMIGSPMIVQNRLRNCWSAAHDNSQ